MMPPHYASFRLMLPCFFAAADISLMILADAAISHDADAAAATL